MKKIALCLFVPLFLNLGTGFSADVDEVSGKTAVPSKKTTAEHEKEAKLRIANFTLPKDISATLFADSNQTQNPSAICFDDQGRLYIAEIHRWRAGVQDIRREQQILLDDVAAETNADRLAMYEKDVLTRPLSFYTEYEDRIVVIEDTTRDGRADKSSVFASGFNNVLDGPGIGLAYLNGSIFYTNIPHLWKLTDADGDGKAEKKESIQDGFGVRMSFSGHDMHGAVVGPDGRIYWSIGDRGYSITTKEGRHYHRPMEGGVFRCDPDGSNVEEIYRGLRNPQELAFDAYGNLFTCDNTADAGDKGRLVYIIEGGDSGWNAGHQNLINFRDQLGLRTPDLEHAEKKLPMNPWITEKIWEPFAENRPEFALPAVDIVSWGPCGLVYNYGATMMPTRYENHFWVCNFGGAKGDIEAFSVKEKGAGFALDHHEVFMEGLGNTDVEFGPDGRMYLSCFNNNGWYKQDLGNVYALFTAKKTPVNVGGVAELLKANFSKQANNDFQKLLAHADLRVRQKAQFELVEKSASDVLQAAAAGLDHQFARFHGIWGLGQLARKDQSLLDALIPLLADKDAEIRAQAAKTLADSRTEKAGIALAVALDDESARVRAFAAMGVGKCRNVTALPKLQEIIIANNNADLFLRHACIQGMWYLNEKEKILKLVDHESPALRLAVLLTLRKLEDPRVKYFLDDAEQNIRYAAVRAINDLDLPTAGPALAAQIEKPTPFATPQDWMIHTRLINANFRLGTAECATRLLEYAARADLPEILRSDALAALEEWPTPSAVDPTLGLHRPLAPAKRADISEVVKANVGPIFATVKGGLVADATRVALKYEAPVPVEFLVSEVQKVDGVMTARIGALRGLAKQHPAALEPLWSELLADKKAKIRAATAVSLVAAKPEAGLDATLKLADSKNLRDNQAAYRILATIDSPKAADLIAKHLADSKKVKLGAMLDLIQAAEKRTEAPVKAALAAYQKSLGDDPLAPFTITMEGGDAEIGKNIFVTHAAGQCAKCHKIGNSGGVAGPDLSDIGKRHDAKYILESLVNPSAVVVPGYGMTMMTLKNGDSIGGTFLKEDDATVTLKIPDPKNNSQQIEQIIPKTDIATRQPPISAMPPMNLLLKKGEIRDVAAYLQTLKTAPVK